MDHLMKLSWRDSDDGIWLDCSCGQKFNLGYDATPEDALRVQIEHRMTKAQEQYISSFAEQDAKALVECEEMKAKGNLRPWTIHKVLQDTYGDGPAEKAMKKVYPEWKA